MIGELHFLTVAEASRLIRRREISPVELVEAFLRRIETVDGALHSYVAVLGDRAIDAARTAEQEIAVGAYRGPLHGIPYGMKDIFHVAGVGTTACSRLMLDYKPTTSATAHTKLQAAGAILLGKLNSYEFGTGMAESLSELPFPPVRNPWNLSCFTGGSSTGSGAAVAAGTAMFALGADTGGSVRLPAAGCGLLGLKPTYGRVSRAGVLPNSFTLDCIGPLTWTVTDAAMALQAIAGHDPRDPTSTHGQMPDYLSTLDDGVAGLRIGVVWRFHMIDNPADPAIAAAFERSIQVFRELDVDLVEIDPPTSQQNFLDCLRIISASEFYSIHRQYFLNRRAEMGNALRNKLTMGACIPASDYLNAQRWRGELSLRVDAAFADCDAFLCCGTTHPPPRSDDPQAVAGFSSRSAMSPFSLTGHPAIAVCNGFTESGLPLNMQIVGPYLGEAMLLRIAAAYERATGWRQRRPLLTAAEMTLPHAKLPLRDPVEVSAADILDEARKLMINQGLTDIGETEMRMMAAQFLDARDTSGRLKRAFAPDHEPMPTLDLPRVEKRTL